MTPTPRRLIPIYCSGLRFDGTSGRTQPSIQPTTVQISQAVSPMGAMTIRPVRKLALRPERRAGDESDVMPPFGEKLAGNKRILLRSAEYQTSYDVHNSQFVPHIESKDISLLIEFSRIIFSSFIYSSK